MAMGIMDALDAQFKRMASDPGRGQAKQVMQAVNQRQPVNPVMGLAAAAALQQTPQPQAQAPQGTVLQRLAQQAAPMGAMGGMGQGQLASPQGQPQMGQAPMPPQMQGMAGGGLVSFAEGGILPPDVLEAIQEHFAQGGAVRGFAEGQEVDAAPHFLPSSWIDTFERMMSPSPGRPRDALERERLAEREEAARTPPNPIMSALKSLVSPSPGKPRSASAESEEIKDDDYADIMRGEAGETFPGAGLASLPRSGKVDPDTGATINTRVKPHPETKQAGYKTPEEQTVDLNSRSAPASSLTEGESYGEPESAGGIGGLEQMRDMLSELRGHKKISPDIQKRLDEMKEQARMSTIFQTVMGGLAGGLSSYGRGPHAWGDAAMQSLAAYQHGAGAESTLDKDIFNIQRDYADASVEEQQKAADFLLKSEEEKAKLASEERRAANRGGLSYGERAALQTQKDTAAEARARIYGDNRDITNREASARQSAEAEYKTAIGNGENPNYIAILEKYRRKLGLAEDGLGGGGLGGSGGLTVTRQGISR